MFGLSSARVQRAIRALPDARRCDRYCGWPEGDEPAAAPLVRGHCSWFSVGRVGRPARLPGALLCLAPASQGFPAVPAHKTSCLPGFPCCAAVAAGHSTRLQPPHLPTLLLAARLHDAPHPACCAQSKEEQRERLACESRMQRLPDGVQPVPAAASGWVHSRLARAACMPCPGLAIAVTPHGVRAANPIAAASSSRLGRLRTAAVQLPTTQGSLKPLRAAGRPTRSQNCCALCLAHHVPWSTFAAFSAWPRARALPLRAARTATACATCAGRRTRRSRTSRGSSSPAPPAAPTCTRTATTWPRRRRTTSPGCATPAPWGCAARRPARCARVRCRASPLNSAVFGAPAASAWARWVR